MPQHAPIYPLALCGFPARDTALVSALLRAAPGPLERAPYTLWSADTETPPACAVVNADVTTGPADYAGLSERFPGYLLPVLYIGQRIADGEGPSTVGFIGCPLSSRRLVRQLDRLLAHGAPIAAEQMRLRWQERRVLVVDADPLAREDLLHPLEAMGVVVDTAEDAQAAYARVEHQGYDLAFIDLRLPDDNGLNLCRAFRDLPHVGSVIMTGRGASRMDRMHAHLMGATRYQSKPLGPDNLPRLLAEHFATSTRSALGARTSGLWQ